MMNKGELKPLEKSLELGIYRHFKGGLYEVIAIGRHSETLEEMVVYKALYDVGDIWVRPASMWEDEVKYEGKIVKRFTWVSDLLYRN